jgi:hypothetical protein
MVGLCILAVVLSIVIALPLLSPLLTTAPIVRPLLRRVRAGQTSAVTGAFWRWALTVFLTILISAAFVRDRMLASFPFSSGTAESLELALAGLGGAPAGILYVVAGMAAFVAASAVSLGIAACVLMAVALGMAATEAAVVFTHGDNVLLAALVALPPWQWAVLGAAALAFAPSALAGGSRLYGIGESALDPVWLKRRAMIASGLFILAVLLRLVLAGPYLSLVRHCTVF